ncbi:NAD(P)H-dependent oxidoreductase [candidate division TA06 bacterium]|uniref:NAD(P)H-dependent oxidoreductase n=1 Tax=candidate division TA06 bacterium TaxID=2250710 RepID=A0A933IB35_UNCT6|nr:NAD(P)H-dependent oxidoreductase [candidate division TA06 bacterium]
MATNKTNILIIYDSYTGNTEKLAKAVAQGAEQVEGARIVVKKADKVKLPDMLAADGIIIGSPAYYGLMTARLKGLLDSTFKIHGKLAGKAGAAFTTAGSTATGAETTLLSILTAMLIHGMVVQGRSSEKHFGAACVGAPDAKAIKFGEDLGKRTALLAGKLKA